MSPVRILVDSLADEGLPNAQMTNAREIVRRLDTARFRVSIFHVNSADRLVASRPNTRLIPLPQHRQTVRIFHEFVFGDHHILFYLKASPASRWYLHLRRYVKDHRVVLGTVESQSDLRNEPTIAPEAVKLWERTVLRCDHLFSNSREVQRSLEKEYGLASGIVPTGVDTKFFTPRWERAPNPRPRVLFVGSLRPFKGPQVLLDAAARFPQADFVLAGDGVLAPDLRTRIQNERLGNVALLGAIGAAAVREQYQQADVFLFPSRWEGSPKVILEAAACGLPVVARKNYEPETVVDGQTGYLVASDAEISTRLEELLSGADLRRSLGEAGRRHSQRFDWDVITKQWEAIFERLVSQKEGGRGH